MLKHKKLLSALLAAVMLFTVTGCGGTDDEAEDAGATSWEETANITATDETDEELYEQAIAEGGEVTLYSISSRCTKVAEAFMDKYPEITCTPFDISTTDLLDRSPVSTRPASMWRMWSISRMRTAPCTMSMCKTRFLHISACRHPRPY
ncbi:MAG: hypothetical protein ACLTYN_08675 [Dysosmobacter welbionis]